VTARERAVLDRFIKHVNKKLNRIEANYRDLLALHDLEKHQLQKQIAQLRKRQATP
jgi:predicted aldo/keto reductase-like oxidoreductase